MIHVNEQDEAVRDNLLNLSEEMPVLSRLARLAAVLALATLVSACTEQRVLTLHPAPADLFDRTVPFETVETHAIAGQHGHVVAGAGEGAGMGFLGGGLGSIGAGAQSGDSLGFAVGVLLAPVFAVGGGIYGAAAAHPAEETKAAVAAIEAVYADEALMTGLGSRVAERIGRLGFPSLPPCREAEPCPPAMGNRLSLTVSYAFRTQGKYSPVLSFAISAEGVASGPDAAREAEDFRWGYRSPEMDFFTATADGAAGLRRYLAEAQDRMAAKIVDDLILARHETRIAGLYSEVFGGENFRPEPTLPGVAVRVASRSDVLGMVAGEISEQKNAQVPRASDTSAQEPKLGELNAMTPEEAAATGTTSSAEPAVTMETTPPEKAKTAAKEEVSGVNAIYCAKSIGGPPFPWRDLKCERAGF